MEDFQNGDSMAARSEESPAKLEGLRLLSHTVQAGKAPQGTVVTVRELINLPKEVIPQPILVQRLCSSSSK
jgi:hypothetical protein